MLKLTLPDDLKDSGLAMPGSTPRTLIQVDTENLPYACQCPLCGGLFSIPEGLLYKVEEDALLDGEFTDDDAQGNGPETNINVMGGSDSGSAAGSDAGSPESTGSEPAEAGESNDIFV